MDTSNGKKLDTKGEAWSVLQTSDSGYIIEERINSDIRLIKVDTTCNEQWKKIFGSEKRDEFYFVNETSRGDYILAGYTQSYRARDRDAWVIRIKEPSAYASETTVADRNKPAEKSTPGFEILWAMVSVVILFLLMRKRT